MALSQEEVDAPATRNTWLSDGHGLVLRTSAKGAKTWYRTVNDNGRPKRVRLGDASGPDALSLAEAREIVRGKGEQKARNRVKVLEHRIAGLDATVAEQRSRIAALEAANLSLVHQHNSMIDMVKRLGLTPERSNLEPAEWILTAEAARLAGEDWDATAERIEAARFDPIQRAEGPAFRHYADKWIEHNRGVWSDGTLRLYRSKIKNHLAGIMDLPVSGLTTAQLAAILNGVRNGTRVQLAVCIRGPLTLALAEGAITEDVAGARLNALIVRERVEVEHRKALDFADAPAFYRSLGDSTAEKALKLLMLCATRVYAVSGGSAAEVEGDVWTVPDSRQPQGKTTPRVPLCAEAMRQLDGLGAPENEVRKLVRGRPITLHGFRTTFRNWAMRQAGFSFEAKELALGHKLPGSKVVRAYERDDLLDERRELMAKWAAYLAGEA